MIELMIIIMIMSRFMKVMLLMIDLIIIRKFVIKIINQFQVIMDLNNV